MESMRRILTTVDLHRSLNSIDPRWAYALRLRYGIGCEPHTLQAGGDKLGVGRARFQQLVDRAMKALLYSLHMAKYFSSDHECNRM
jgi:DNA-directed RNA polymerase sigma subunit (sigma70/sigma32)